MDLHAGSCWAQIDSRRRRDGLHSPITAYCALPFVLGGLRIGLSIFFDELMNRVDDRVRIFAGRHHDFDFVPQPLPTGREVEEVAFDGIAVYKSYFASSGMAGVGPIAGFEQHCAQQIYFNHFTDNAIDLHPITDANAIASHQHEPANESHDEIFEGDGQPCAGQPKDGRHLAWDSEQHEENQQHTDGLDGKANDDAKGFQPRPLVFHIDDEVIDDTTRYVDGKQN